MAKATKKPIDEADLKKAEVVLRAYALAFPETKEDHPWGESAFKVKGKTFLFLSRHDGGLNLSMKLPRSREFALDYPFTQPTGYGLGKAGWVTIPVGGTARGAGDLDELVDVLRDFVEESYRAVAPKKLVKELDAGADSGL
jgi:predicted DNA-binding protein (MmcQ/YjbR family)